MVEFALIGPLFFLFVVLIIQGALYINAQDTLDNVTREVARAVAVCGTTKGSWNYRNSDYKTDTATGDGCQAVALGQLRQTNFLPRNTAASQMLLAVCTDSASLANGHCSGGYTAPASIGQEVEVTVTYTYTFYVDPLLGSYGPSVQMLSSARVVTQQ